MHRPYLNAVAFVVAGLFSICAVPSGAFAEDARPNIILCMGDDHGWDEVGYNRHPHVKTPVAGKRSLRQEPSDEK